MNIIEHIKLLIRTNSTYSETRVVLDGKTTPIKGRCTGMIDLRRKVIEVFTADSTPSDHHIDPRAEEQFNVAAEKLVRNGEIFYTALRADWSIPVVEWTRS